MKMNDRFLNKLSDAQHDIWSHWMKYLFSVSEKLEDGSYKIDKEKAEKWNRQMMTDFNDLSEKEKESDRDIVKKFIFHLLIEEFENEI